MALDIGIWLIFTIGATALCVGGMYYKLPHLFVLGCAMFIGSAGLLWAFDGLLLERQLTSVVGGVLTYTDVSITMNNIGMQVLSLILVAVPILSALIINLDTAKSPARGSPFHF